MCGIVGYTGERQALPVLMDGLRRLEYRGYDSAGVAVAAPDGPIVVRKAEGKLSALADLVDRDPPRGTTGIGHTRWATHGAPSSANAHPHGDAAGRVVIVHNGIIENYLELRQELPGDVPPLRSETDTEVVARQIGAAYRRLVARANGGADPEAALQDAVASTLARVEGSFAIVAMSVDAPDVIVAARRFSPLVVGLGDGEQFVASDIPALLAHTRRFLVMEDDEIAVVRPSGVTIFDADGAPIAREPLQVDWDPAAAEKGGYEHFVRKEIEEQPSALAETLRGRLIDGRAELPDLDGLPLSGVRRAYVVAAGSSHYAGLYGKLLLERWARLPVEVTIASELRYGDPVLGEDTLVLGITQSGETADTLAALRMAKAAGAPTLALTNVVGSSVTRLADVSLQLQVGPEIGVVATKTFTGQLTLLVLVALAVGRIRGTLDEDSEAEIVTDLRGIPEAVERALSSDADAAAIAGTIATARSAFFMGRGFGYPVALEGALKLKEISYIHAEGYPAGELKHGPIAMLEPSLPVVAVATRSRTRPKMRSNMEEVRARSAPVFAVVTEGDTETAALAERSLFVPRVREELAPIVDVVPLQLLSYHTAVVLGRDVDQPRNLAKSVTVE